MVQVLHTIADVLEFNKSLDDGQYFKLVFEHIIVYNAGGDVACRLGADVSDQIWLYLEAR